MYIIDYIATGVGLIGVGVIIWGVVLTLFRWVIFEVRSLHADTTCRKRESIRIQLGSYLLLGLEFLIASRWEPYGFLGEATFVGSLLFGGSPCVIQN